MRPAERQIDTGDRRVVDLTDEVVAPCEGLAEVLLSAFAPHATAGRALMGTGSGSEANLEQLVERLLGRDGRYRRRHGSPGHGADDPLPLPIGPSLTIPVAGGAPSFGA